jgi:hypothetical protein
MAMARAAAAKKTTAAPATLGLSDGSRVEVLDGAARILDPEGRVIVHYKDGSATIVAPAGDLRLSAPAGRVVLESGVDVEIAAKRDIVQRAGRSAEVHAGEEGSSPKLRIGESDLEVTVPRVEVRADQTNLVVEHATVLAARIVTTAGVIAESVERLEVTATRLFERTRDAFRDTTGLAQTRAGRVRTLVEDALQISAKRTTMTSTEETTIDGSKVLLG